MKKSAYLILVVLMLFACSEKKKENNVEVTTLSSLNKSEVKNDIKKSISVADVKGNSQTSGSDIADVKEDVISQENGYKKKSDGIIKVEPKVIDKKIIKDGRLGLQVDNLQIAKQKIDSLVKAVGGYYANENLKNSDNQSGYELVIRIPIMNFERFVGFAEKGSSKVLYKEIQARDVTEEFVDLDSRLNSKRNSLARYNEIMKKANTVKRLCQLQHTEYDHFDRKGFHIQTFQAG